MEREGSSDDDDDDVTSLDILRRLSSLQQTRQGSARPLWKRGLEWQRRAADSQEEEHKDGDWDANGWAGNNLRIWG